ncbi:MAG: glutamine synthetase [Gammaproteobacteria bacterium]|nr:glutamine synthetase [Gammaproteobacteria bacterium]MCP4880360.1 glutamine synthetase [Gammaproteobacteria bacterium]MDP6165798.1 glutamine synthetase family protein [Gammaproteobacteria bacterium]
MTNFRRIRTIYADHLGLARGKYQPAATAAHGQARFCQTAYGLTFDRDLLPVEGSGLLTGLPDMVGHYKAEDIRLGWEADTGVAIVDLTDSKGNPIAVNGRNALKRALAAYADMGLSVNIGIELEAFVFEKDAQGNWTPYDTPGAYVYGAGSSVDPLGLIDQVWEQAEAMGIELESFNSEFDCSQFELTLRYGEAMAAIDDLLLFKTMAKEIYTANGFLLSFMPKPIADRGGSGLHVNFSFSDAAGNNVINDTNTQDGLSTLCKQAIAGLVKHHEGLAGIMAPTVNSYRRLQPASLSGYWANWGYDHRGVTTRIPDERGATARIEFRMGDCSANIYTAAAATLQAALLGIQNDYDLPAAEELDCLESQSTDRHTPDNLGEALAALVADTHLCQAIGQELIDNHVGIKTQEWENYLAYISQTSQWETDFYLNFV